jgi:hypothetical protein
VVTEQCPPRLPAHLAVHQQVLSALEVLDGMSRPRPEDAVDRQLQEPLELTYQRAMAAPAQDALGHGGAVMGLCRHRCRERNSNGTGAQKCAQRPPYRVLQAILTHRALHGVLGRICNSSMICS